MCTGCAGGGEGRVKGSVSWTRGSGWAVLGQTPCETGSFKGREGMKKTKR